MKPNPEFHTLLAEGATKQLVLTTKPCGFDHKDEGLRPRADTIETHASPDNAPTQLHTVVSPCCFVE